MAPTEIELADGETVGKFLRLVAKIAEARGKIVLIVE